MVGIAFNGRHCHCLHAFQLSPVTPKGSSTDVKLQLSLSSWLPLCRRSAKIEQILPHSSPKEEAAKAFPSLNEGKCLGGSADISKYTTSLASSLVIDSSVLCDVSRLVLVALRPAPRRGGRSQAATRDKAESQCYQSYLFAG